MRSHLGKSSRYDVENGGLSVSNANNEKVMLLFCVCSCRFPGWSTSSVRFKMDEISPVRNQPTSVVHGQLQDRSSLECAIANGHSHKTQVTGPKQKKERQRTSKLMIRHDDARERGSQPLTAVKA